MDLIEFNGSEVIIRLYPSDCATLAQALAVAEAELVSEADRSLKKIAGNYAALFPALSMGIMAPGRLTPWEADAMSDDLLGFQPGEEDWRP